jgi:hypothetical protein
MSSIATFSSREVSLLLDNFFTVEENLFMQKFSNWLDGERGRASKLAEYIGYSVSFISNVKAGRKRLPPHLFVHIEEFSNGELTLLDLVPMVPLGHKRRA